jgi:hypothetical protein
VADRATLILLSVIAAALAVVVIVDSGGQDGTVIESRRVVPGFRPSAAQRIIIEQSGGPATVIERGGDGFALTEPMQAPADAAAVDDLLGTLELLSFRRRGGAPSAETGLSPPAATVTVEVAGGGRFELGIGARAGELDRVWVSHDGASYLVDGYAARALVRSAEELRSRRPLPFRRDQLTGIELHHGDTDLVLSGRPLAVHLDGGGAVRAAPAAVDDLVDRLHELRFRRFAPAAGEPAPGALTVRVLGAAGPLRLAELGPCPGDPALRLIESSAGPGCVAAAELEAIAARAEGGPELLDRALVYRDGRSVTALAIEAGERDLRLEARGRAWTVTEDAGEERRAEPEAIRDWLEELSDTVAGEPIPAAALEPGPPEATVEAGHGPDLRERITIHHLPDRGLVARRGNEPVFWPLSPDSVTELLPAGGFRSRQLLTREPFGLRRVQASRGGRVLEELVRGELAGDWSAGDAAVISGTLEQLRPVVAGLRAERFARAGEATGLASPRRVIEVELDPPPGAAEPLRHTIEVGASADEGCYARVDGGTAAVLAEGDCQVLLGPWTR